VERIRRLEVVCGLVAGLYGVALSGVLTLVIRATGASSCSLPIDTCIAGMNSITFMFLVLFTALSLGVMLGALAHGRSQRAGALGVLLLCTVVLAMEAFLAMFSIGVLFAPAVLAGVVASLYALVSESESNLPVRSVLELAAGFASGMIGIAALDYVFFFPSIQYNGPDFGGLFNVAGFYGLGKVLPALLTFGLVAFLIAGGASSNALRGSRSGRALLIVAALALGAAAIASQFVDDTLFYLHTVGIWLLPSLGLALVAAVLALAGHGGRAPVAAA
jgi:hypothetical protein